MYIKVFIFIHTELYIELGRAVMQSVKSRVASRVSMPGQNVTR